MFLRVKVAVIREKFQTLLSSGLCSNMELALLLLLILPLCSAQRTYYVTTATTPCPTSESDPEACCILSECAQNVSRYFASNTTLLFLPGIHVLETPVHVEGGSILTLSGDPSSLPQVTSRIICKGDPAAYFLFNATLELEISALAFESCGSGNNSGLSLLSVYNSQIENCVFQNCSSDALVGPGGALSLQSVGNTVISDCTFMNNSASVGGAAFVSELIDSGVSFFRNDFMENTAQLGGGIYVQLSNMTIIGNSFVRNHASLAGGGLATLNSDSITFFSDTVFVNNSAGSGMGIGGGLYVVNTATVFFYGNTTFRVNAAALLGGAMIIFNSSVMFAGSVGFEINFASYGAAIAIVQSSLIVENASFQNNVGIYGASIYSREADLTFSEGTTFCKNVASLGGAIYASSSNLNFEGNSNLSRNIAGSGGGLLLTDGSRINLFPSAKLYFGSNYATETGGAIRVEESTPLGYCTNISGNVSLTEVVSGDCFFQLQNETVTMPSEVEMFMTFENNSANQGGGDLYGGTVDSCRFTSDLCNGLSSCSGTVFDRVTGDESQSLSVSSDPLRVCLCGNDPETCNFYISMEAYPGQSLSILATTLGQRNGSTAGVIRADIPNDNIRIQDLENIQRTNGNCTNLQYTLLTSLQNAVTNITLFTDGPCQRVGRSLVLRASILPCPPGFQLSELRCVCDERLNDFTDICDINTGAILRRSGAEFWVGYDNDSQELILDPQCPFDYCTLDGMFVSAIDSDTQCNYNRSGVLCGGCSGTTSLVLGSSRCM